MDTSTYEKYKEFHGEIQQDMAVDAVIASYFPADYKGVFLILAHTNQLI
jgi:ribosomal protein RSM22 (predicted rRNA methylase)